MTNTAPAVEVRKAPRGWAIYAGKSILARGFKTREAAEQHAEENALLLSYWAGGVSVSIENAEWHTIYA